MGNEAVLVSGSKSKGAGTTIRRREMDPRAQGTESQNLRGQKKKGTGSQVEEKRAPN